MATKFTPLHDRILVRRVEESAITRGGIRILESAKYKPQEGEVISVGKGRSNEDGKVFPLAVKEGDPSRSVSMPALTSKLTTNVY